MQPNWRSGCRGVMSVSWRRSDRQLHVSSTRETSLPHPSRFPSVSSLQNVTEWCWISPCDCFDVEKVGVRPHRPATPALLHPGQISGWCCNSPSLCRMQARVLELYNHRGIIIQGVSMQAYSTTPTSDFEKTLLNTSQYNLFHTIFTIIYITYYWTVNSILTIDIYH
jgi:hypothetical protein